MRLMRLFMKMKVHATFDGSIVNMGVKDENGDTCYIIGILKAICKRLHKVDGDHVHVVIRIRE